MVKTIITDEITLKDVKKWISKSKSLHSLQSIRAKTNKRIKIITKKKEISPFSKFSLEEKKEIIKDLFL